MMRGRVMGRVRGMVRVRAHIMIRISERHLSQEASVRVSARVRAKVRAREWLGSGEGGCQGVGVYEFGRTPSGLRKVCGLRVRFGLESKWPPAATVQSSGFGLESDLGLGLSFGRAGYGWVRMRR